MALDPLLPLWLIVAGSLVAGVVTGILFERITGPATKRAAKFEADLVQVRSDFMCYQQETARHFGKGAELLGRMATDYREFLDHFVSGAEELCGGTMKEISVNGLELPLLDGAGTTATPAIHAAAPTDSEPLAEDTPK